MRKFVVGIVLCCLISRCLAQSENLNFYSLSLRDGLPTKDIRCVYQDSFGFLWMASYEGLIRWDGYTFKKYTHDNESPRSLSNNIVYCIFEDHRKNLWIGTIDGLTLFDRTADQFTKCKIRENINEIPVNSIVEDSKGKLWLGTSSGLCHYDHSAHKSQWFIQGNDSNYTSNKDVIFCLAADHADNLWLGTFNSGVQKFDQTTKVFTTYKSEKNNAQTLCSNDIRSIMVDEADNIWIGSKHHGITVMNHEGHVIKQYNKFSGKDVSTQSTVNTIYQDKHDRIWIGLDREPLYYIDASGNPASTLYYNPTAEGSRIPHAISSVCEDSFGNIWYASTSEGLYMMNPNKNVFKNLLNSATQLKGLRSNIVTCFYENTDGTIWIGTEEGGLIQYIPDENKFILNPIVGNMTSQGITDIKGDRNGNLWLSFWSGGLVRFDPRTKSIQNFIHADNDNNSLIYNDVKCLLPDDTLLWIGTNGAGLSAYDLKNKKFIHYKNNRKFNFQMNEPGWINHLFKDSKNRLWISTYAGVFILQDNALKHFTHSASATSIASNTVKMITEDHHGKIWIISGEHEVDEYVEGTQSFKRHGNLTSENIKAIVVDQSGMLWLTGGSNMLSVDPLTLKTKKFTNADGLIQDAFFDRSILVSKKNELFVGGHSGFNSVNPALLKDAPKIKQFYFTDLYIFNEIQKPHADNTTLTQTLASTNQLALNYRQSFFSIEFAALDLYAPGSINYSYKLEGLHNEWINIRGERKVSFTNLDPGSYKLKVRYARPGDEWTEAPQSLAITILPPWWKTVAFKILLSAVVAGSIVGIFYIRVASIRKRNMILKEAVARSTKELREVNAYLSERNGEIEHQHEKIKLQNEKLELYNEEILAKSDKILKQQQHITDQNYALEQTVDELQKLNQTKDHFFSILAHDLKNPIAGITGIAEYLKKNYTRLDKKDTYEHLNSIFKSSNAVYDLLINLLNWSRTQSKHIQYTPSDINLFELVQRNVALVEQQFSLKNITLSIDLSDAIHIYADYNMMDAVVRNLLNNSIKFTDYNGSISLSAETTTEGVRISFKDSGVGMSPKQIEKLFQLDKNNISRGTAGEQGTGLGLVIAHEFIKINNGTIHVESELGRGTTFHVTVPASDKQRPAVQKQIQTTHASENQNGVEVWEKFPTEMLVKIRGRKILIVDDNKELRTYLRFILSSTFEIFEAENGKEGISIANQIQPAVIISDLIMPVMSGTEFCQAIKTSTETSHIPFILLTSQSAEESQLLGYEAGADVYLAKPVKKEILVRVIANFIQNQEKIWKKINENFLDANTTYIPDLAVSEVDQALLNKLIDFIESNVSKQNIDSVMICQHLGVSRTVLYAKIKALTGQGVHEFIKSLRLKKSLKMLLEGKYTIGQITQEVGFTSHSYFNRCFVKQYGMTPKDYINSRKQKKA